MSDAERAFFRAIPKVELHCHLLGAIRRETFVDLVRQRNAPIDAAEVDAFYERGERPVGVLRVLRALEQHLLLAPDDFRRIAWEYLVDAAGDGVRHAEFFWNPTATTRDAGLAYADVQAAILAGIGDAHAEVGISALLIPSIDREAPPADAVTMVEAMLAARHCLVPGIGIDYRENDRPPELFADAYARARAGGLRTTAHAGEFGMPWTNVATAVDVLGVDRIDHGYTIVDNPELAARCADRLVFTVVPTNSYYLRTLAPERWALDHPIRRMAALGLRLHPNTDDPTLHHVTPSGTWELMYSHLGFSIGDLRAMMLNGIEASWAEPTERENWAAAWIDDFDQCANTAGLRITAHDRRLIWQNGPPSTAKPDAPSCNQGTIGWLHPRARRPGSPIRYFNSSPNVIRLVVLMYVRFPLLLRNAENLLFERGIDICHETVCVRGAFACSVKEPIEPPVSHLKLYRA